jgi:hypothetical protein
VTVAAKFDRISETCPSAERAGRNLLRAVLPWLATAIIVVEAVRVILGSSSAATLVESGVGAALVSAIRVVVRT